MGIICANLFDSNVSYELICTNLLVHISIIQINDKYIFNDALVPQSVCSGILSIARRTNYGADADT